MSVFKYAAGTGKKIAKSLDPREPIFQKNNRRSIDNLFTGYGLGGKGRLAVTGAFVAGGSMIAGDMTGAQNAYQLKKLTDQSAEEQDIESLASTRGDGVGYTANTGSMTNVQAQGDLVFALHKVRNGG